MPKPKTKSDYSRLIVDVRKDNYYPVRIEYFDKGGKACKLMQRRKIEKIDGYWEARETIIQNLKNGHQTTLIQENIKFNTNIPDEKFTERYLTR